MTLTEAQRHRGMRMISGQLESILILIMGIKKVNTNHRTCVYLRVSVPLCEAI
jgi:hypothetical protein